MATTMRRITLLTLAALLMAPLAPVYAADKTQPTAKPWITVGDDGKLRYQNTSNGDRILDFSHAGYGGGGMKLPNVPVRKKIAPSGGDDSSVIQAAIDAVAALPLADGFRGAVLLQSGVFRCAKPLTVSKDGIVLRGAGAGEEGTVIEMTGPPHTAVTIEGERLRFPKEDPASIFAVADAYVPSGTLSFSVKEAKGLAAGDVIRIRWPRTATWIHFMGMDTLVRNGKPQTWIKNDSPIMFERSIRSITGNQLTLDVPLTDSINAQMIAPTTAVVVKTTPPKRLAQCGIESLRINSPPPNGNLSAKNNLAVAFDNCEDCWIKDIVMHDALGNVAVDAGARRITITGAHAFHSATVEKGAGYPADYFIKGSQILLDRCTSQGDGSFYVATLNSEAVLNVALNCTFEGKGSIQPHMHWSTGLLIDSCHLPDGRIDFINRHTAGSGHGWAIGWAVAWNCAAKSLDVQQPPGAMNWCIGCTGELKKSSSQNGPWLSSRGTPVVPSSLYLTQLRERLGESALKNIGY